MADDDAPEKLPRIGVAVLCYVVATLGAIFVWATWRPQGLALAVTIAVPVAALGWLIGRGFARRRAGGCSTPAQRAYVRRFVPMMIAYVVILLGAVWLKKNVAPSGPVTALLAILSAVPLIGVVWAIGRMLIEERDEYQRLLLARQIIVATGFMLSVTSVWGFLEDFGQVPHVPMYWAFIIWCAGLGVGTAWNELRS
ncbi:MAG: hypothetical protein QOG13_2290 [Sphingomonadales bacterium]|jgi:hypothetical protein|nr:hypothetical protein [Sphingomonadales bacterium]